MTGNTEAIGPKYENRTPPGLVAPLVLRILRYFCSLCMQRHGNFRCAPPLGEQVVFLRFPLFWG
jgi:hypothetical protein